MEGLVLAAGCSGHGFGLGPGLGYLAAKLVVNDTPCVDPAPFRLSRLVDGSKLDIARHLKIEPREPPCRLKTSSSTQSVSVLPSGIHRSRWSSACAVRRGAGNRLFRSLSPRFERAVTFSMDDLYLGRAARVDLARRIHPLLATRGVPGTHDPMLGH